MTLDPDLQIIIVDLDDAIECELEDAQPARWSFTCVCGVSWLYCDDHRARFDRKLTIRNWFCSGCDEMIPNPIPWKGL